MSDYLAPVLYIPHGGGPLPLLGEPSHAALSTFLRDALKDIPRPNAILVVSAHWEAPVATVTSGDRPALVYDYHGFPPASYSIRYPAPGAPLLAQRIAQRLLAQGIAVQEDAKQGFDHGMFVPLKLMRPEADIPCVQLSLLSNLNAADHIAMGNAIRELRKENVLVLGSGFSTHNLGLLRTGITADAQRRNDEFQDWLRDACTNPEYDQQERERRLTHWQDAPHARFCHPREEHLLPLMVCIGASREPACCVFDDAMLGMRALAFQW